MSLRDAPPARAGARAARHDAPGGGFSQGAARGASSGVFVGVGANLPAPDGAPPLATCRRALAALAAVLGRRPEASSWYRSAPVPPGDQPWFVNAVARFPETPPPRALLALLLALERRFGRVRGARWAARTLDLDLLAYGARIIDEPGLAVPHPRLVGRAFVLVPLAEIAPGWRHPRDGRGVAELVAALPAGQEIVRIAPPFDDARGGG